MKNNKKSFKQKVKTPLYSVSVDNVLAFFSANYLSAVDEYRQYYMRLGKGEVHMYKQDSITSQKILII